MGFSLLAHALAAGPPPVEANTALSDFGLSVAATAVGAVQGALMVVDEPDYDVVGVVVIAACLGFGGGIVRDVLTARVPVVGYSLDDAEALELTQGTMNLA